MPATGNQRTVGLGSVDSARKETKPSKVSKHVTNGGRHSSTTKMVFQIDRHGDTNTIKGLSSEQDNAHQPIEDFRWNNYNCPKALGLK